MHESQHIVETKGLVKHFPIGGGRFTALRDIDLTVGKGEFTGIVGPSGSGKTTLLNVIGSLDKPSEGAVTVLGRSISALSHRQAARPDSSVSATIRHCKAVGLPSDRRRTS